MLIINVGATGGPTVAAFDKLTGKMVWGAGDEWGPSYASPVPAVIHGERRVLVFAGGESRPPTGGLLSINPSDGKVDFTFPWRSRTYESVNASTPTVIGNQVLISAAYQTGAALLDIMPDFSREVVWTNFEFDLHFTTAIHKDGYLYGFDGRNEPDAALSCIRLSDGKQMWRVEPEWKDTVDTGGRVREITMSTFRGSLMDVDGHFLAIGEWGHLLWLDLTPEGYKELSPRLGRESPRDLGPAGTEPGTALRQPEHEEPRPRITALALLRSARPLASLLSPRKGRLGVIGSLRLNGFRRLIVYLLP